MPNVNRTYTAILIVSPECGEEALSKLEAQFKELVTRHAGKALEASSLGKRRLSYKIGRFFEGTLLQVRVELNPAEVAGLKKAAALIESFLRIIIVKEPAGGAPLVTAAAAPSAGETP